MSPMQVQQVLRWRGARQRSECAEVGPWGYVCTQRSGHEYAHYDSHKDASWTDRWREDFDVPAEAEPADVHWEAPWVSST